MTEIRLPEISEVAELLRSTREERACLKKLFRVLQEAKKLGIPTNSREAEDAHAK